jgi:cobalt-zinc-cadmium efflux system outer membrane protein
VDRSPAVARWQTEIERARASAGLARAEAWPEVRLDAGMRHEDNTDITSYLLGFELPLPFFDRAQGDRSAAEHDLAAVTARQAAARAEVSVEAMTAYQDLAVAHFAARTLRERVIPAATDEFAALRQGFGENAVSVADLLDGARDLTRATLDYLDALIACHEALADLEGLTGQPLAGPASRLDQPSTPGDSR